MAEGSSYIREKTGIAGIEYIETPYGNLEVMPTQAGTVVRGYTSRVPFSYSEIVKTVPREHFSEIRSLLMERGYTKPIWFGRSR